MSFIATLRTFRELDRAQWLDPARIRALQEEKLRRIVDHAYRTVPFYRRRLDGAGIVPDDIRSLDDLRRIPITTKTELQRAEFEEITSSRFSRKDLVPVLTSGSSGRPFTIYHDRHFIHVRNALFLRALRAAGYRFGRKLMLVTMDRDKSSRSLLRWHNASIEDPPEKLLRDLRRSRPELIYSSVTPLRILAELISEQKMALPWLKTVISKAETLDDSTRRSFEETYQAEVFDTYGLSEMGFVGWECAKHSGYHLSEDTAIVESVPLSGGTSSALVMTNLELRGMPLIRYHCGDLGIMAAPGACSCGRTTRRLERIEGRLIDSVRLRDGRVLSPYRFTMEIEQVPGIARYQVIQNDLDSFTLRFEPDGSGGGEVTARVQAVIARLAGAEVRVEVRKEQDIAPPSGQKFRVVESRLPPPDIRAGAIQSDTSNRVSARSIAERKEGESVP